jgi:hypothetical protein
VAGPRVFSLDEANSLVPDLASAFDGLDELRERVKATKVKLNALEMIWGRELNSEDCPDRQEGLALLQEMKDAQEEVGQVVERLGEMGATVKDVHSGLVDLYHVRDGYLVQLCWKRGEEEFEAWHNVDEGFADRQAL